MSGVLIVAPPGRALGADWARCAAACRVRASRLPRGALRGWWMDEARRWLRGVRNLRRGRRVLP